MEVSERNRLLHAKLEHDLSLERAKVSPDEKLIAELKRQKLALKDELLKLRN